MSFKFIPTELPGVVLIEPNLFPDSRGFFMETYKFSEFAAHGITAHYVQENHSHSSRGILRGLHYQNPPKAQGKLVRAVVGEFFDVVVDIRRGSPHYGHWLGVYLSAENKKSLYIPPGFAHGALALSAEAALLYRVTEEYAPECEAGIAWNDTKIGIRWPINEPTLSPRDQRWPPLSEAINHFHYDEPARLAASRRKGAV